MRSPRVATWSTTIFQFNLFLGRLAAGFQCMVLMSWEVGFLELGLLFPLRLLTVLRCKDLPPVPEGFEFQRMILMGSFLALMPRAAKPPGSTIWSAGFSPRTWPTAVRRSPRSRISLPRPRARIRI